MKKIDRKNIIIILLTTTNFILLSFALMKKEIKVKSSSEEHHSNLLIEDFEMIFLDKNKAKFDSKFKKLMDSNPELAYIYTCAYYLTTKDSGVLIKINSVTREIEDSYQRKISHSDGNKE